MGATASHSRVHDSARFLPVNTVHSTVPRRAKFFIAFLLLPVCAGVLRAIIEVGGQVSLQGVVVVPLLAGVACMAAMKRWLPEPMWVYVLGHEFTHALAAMLCGGRVKGMKVSGEGGHVYVTKDNFFVTLAPYFVPLYALIVFAVFILGRVFFKWDTPWAWGVFHWALGLTYTFHVLLTIGILRTRQPDITSQGRLFSGVIILLGNALVLLVGWSWVVGEPGLPVVAQALRDGVLHTFQDLLAAGNGVWKLLIQP